MIRTIAKNEIISAFRNKTALWLAIIFYLLAIVAALGGWKNFSTATQQRRQAKEMFRHQWVEQQANPHSAAHFGTYLFKPFTFISLFDTGLNNYTGNTYRVEAHNQAEMNHAVAQDSDTEMRFGELTIASLFQLFMPLLIIFLCFRSVSAERENQTIKLLFAQGLKPSTLLCGKITGNYLLVTAIILPAMLMMLIATAIREPGMLARMSYFNLGYLLYFLILTAVFVGISALAKSSKNALISSLGVWVLCFVMAPRLVAGFSSRLYPLPSRGEFNKMIETANSKGLQGDKDRTERQKDYLKEVLSRYKVDSVSQLPLNFNGLRMQYGEDYLSKVYLTINGQVEESIGKQQHIERLFGFLDPFIAMQQLSRALAGTDYNHHIHFHKQAQVYRDEFIRKLNLNMAYEDRNNLRSDYKVGPAFFKTMEDFSYSQPEANWAGCKHQLSLYALLFWLGITALAIGLISKKIAIN
ncbi:ABC transporter permease subunit [Pedobacter namyangjuensis]|uniref:ABC transporter permease subunit n=1 Tax=Pedobacter namyangjuensis TaxID=600626 RepID=UPI000DE2ACFC|nr:ABC transporter permease subunit [Pedobacter namyangjuensis]